MLSEDPNDYDPPEIQDWVRAKVEEKARMMVIQQGLETKMKNLISEHFQGNLRTLSAEGFRQLQEKISYHLWSLADDVSDIIDDEFPANEEHEPTPN